MMTRLDFPLTSDLSRVKVVLKLVFSFLKIQIRVHAAGVNPVDTYIRSGTHSRRPQLPYVPGLDSAGVVSKLGKNVKNFKVT
jgi:D-arabinose 1-dehydrogenase-like Zn-dependent alcohol dehydrogenase